MILRLSSALICLLFAVSTASAQCSSCSQGSAPVFSQGVSAPVYSSTVYAQPMSHGLLAAPLRGRNNACGYNCCVPQTCCNVAQSCGVAQSCCAPQCNNRRLGNRYVSNNCCGTMNNNYCGTVAHNYCGTMANNCCGNMGNNCCGTTQMACMTPACGGCAPQMAAPQMAAAPMLAAPAVAATETVATDSTFTAAPMAQQEGAPVPAVTQEAAPAPVMVQGSPCGGCGMSVVGAPMGYDNCNSCGNGYGNGWYSGNNCCNTTYATGCNNGRGSRARILGSRRSARCCY